MKKHLAAAAAALVLLASPASAATLDERDEFITKFLNNELTPEEPWAHTKEIRVTDGWAFEPRPIKDAWVSFVNTKGYVKPPPPPPPSESASTAVATTESANLGAGVGYSADWQAIAECEGGGDWSMVKPDADPYYFVLQFHPTTWLGYGGTQAELDAGVAPSPSRLIEVAEAVLAAQGPGAWPNCFRSL